MPPDRPLPDRPRKPVRTGPADAATGHRVLVIDDDDDDRHIIARALRKARPGIEIVEAGNARDGLDRLDSDAPDLVLLDLRMAGVDGFEVLSKAKAGERGTATPVVVLSTSDNPDDVRRAYRLCANAYVQKPATMDDYERLARSLVDFWIEATVRV